jgi:hypothetical protein
MSSSLVNNIDTKVTLALLIEKELSFISDTFTGKINIEVNYNCGGITAVYIEPRIRV